MSREEFEKIYKQVEASGLKFAVYPKTFLVNVIDCDGITQSYYASTGTAMFRDGNDWKKNQSKKVTGMSLERFLYLCKGEGDEDIITLYFSI